VEKTPSVEGSVYAILRRDASISQNISGLVIGAAYQVSWYQQGNSKKLNNIFVSLGGKTVWGERLVVTNPSYWEANTSAEFTATSSTAELKIWTESLSKRHAVFIDAVSVHLDSVQPLVYDYVSDKNGNPCCAKLSCFKKNGKCKNPIN